MRLLDLPEGGRLLDMGGGTGSNLESIADKVPRGLLNSASSILLAAFCAAFWALFKLNEGGTVIYPALYIFVEAMGSLVVIQFWTMANDVFHAREAKRLFGLIGHFLCGLCFVACLFTDSLFTFFLAISLAAFWNDLTMGSAWASCLDIGRKYSGIVAGCMNTVGNLGGALSTVTFQNVNVPVAGTYPMEIDYMTQGQRSFFISVNGSTATELVLNGYSWGTPTSTVVQVLLHAGSNQIQFSNPSNYAPNLDSITLSPPMLF